MIDPPLRGEENFHETSIAKAIKNGFAVGLFGPIRFFCHNDPSVRFLRFVSITLRKSKCLVWITSTVPPSFNIVVLHPVR